MKITAQLSGVNRPLSVELRLINFCSSDFDSREKYGIWFGRELLAKRSDFRSAKGLVQCSPFEGVADRLNWFAMINRALSKNRRLFRGLGFVVVVLQRQEQRQITIAIKGSLVCAKVLSGRNA